MYQFSRSIYRELSPYVDGGRSAPTAADAHARVLRACEAAIERLATDRRYFARPARTLFNDVRMHFPMSAQSRVYHVVETHLNVAQQFFATQAMHGYDTDGNPLQCRATTRKGSACQRIPLARNGYCPSHQHLAETEDVGLAA